MHNDQIDENFNLFEERLQRLEGLALHNEIDSMGPSRDHLPVSQINVIRELQVQIRELRDSLADLKGKSESIPTQEIVDRVAKFLVEESQDMRRDLCISSFSQGFVSSATAEKLLAMVFPCAKVALKSASDLGPLSRLQRQLFSVSSFHIEMSATSEGVYFAITDDGKGAPQGTRGSEFAELREQVARAGGSFHFRVPGEYGGKVEIKIPHQRVPEFSHVLSWRGFHFGISSAYVERVYPEASLLAAVEQEGLKTIYVLDEAAGLTAIEPEEITALPFQAAALLGVADFHFLVVCERIEQGVFLRKLKSPALFGDGAWLSSVAVYEQGECPHLMPYFDGDALLKIYHREGGSA